MSNLCDSQWTRRATRSRRRKASNRVLFFPNISGRQGGWPKPDSDSQIHRFGNLYFLKPCHWEFQPILGRRRLADVWSSVSKAQFRARQGGTHRVRPLLPGQSSDWIHNFPERTVKET